MTDSTTQFKLVTFTVDDTEDPRNWSTWKKKRVVLILCILSFCSSFGSSCYAAGEKQIRSVYGINEFTASSGLTLYVLGFALGPLLWPVSEMYGRKYAYTLSWPLMIAFIVPSAFVENIIVILFFRFFVGACAACALNNGSGVIADMYNHTPLSMGQAVSWYIFCPLSGPCLGSVVGFFTAAHSPGSQLWVVRVHLLFSIACWPLVLLLPETHGPTILSKRAKKLREEGQENSRASHELHDLTHRQLLSSHILRPMGMMFTEPIVQGVALWVGLAYALIYFFFEMYPQVFIVQHHIDFQLCGLFFIPVMIGMLFAIAPYRFSMSLFAGIRWSWLERKPNPIEDKLKIVLWACCIMPVSLFWFAWTSGSETPWEAAAASGFPFGYATVIIFFTFSAYTSQIYTVYASSAAACNTFVRSLIGCIFPLVAHPVMKYLGTKWGVFLFGFLSLGLLPIPLIFIRYGPELRASSKYAQEAAEIIRKMRGSDDLVDGEQELSSQAALLEGSAPVDDKTAVPIEKV